MKSKKRGKKASLLAGALLALPLAALSAMPVAALEPEDLMAEAAVLIDVETGQILYDKNAHVSMYPASTTKVMTGMLALERFDPGYVITATETALEEISFDSSHISLAPGEEISVGNALYALIMPSANDAANVLAEAHSGSLEAFAGEMTAKARELGARNTQFANAHGLHDDSHFTTAYDMALITRAAIETPGFLTYFGATRYTMSPTNLQTEERPFTNYQYMLLEDQDWAYNPDVIGGKVGYTHEAGHTMTTAAARDGRTLIAVVFQTGKDQKFYDTQALLDYGFHEFSRYRFPVSQPAGDAVPLLDGQGETVGNVRLSLEEDVPLWLHESVNPSDIRVEYDIPPSFVQGEELAASARFLAEGREGTVLLRTVDLVPDVEYTFVPVSSALDGLEEKSGEEPFRLPPYLLPVAASLICLAVVAAAGMVVLRQMRLARRRKARMERMRRNRVKGYPGGRRHVS